MQSNQSILMTILLIVSVTAAANAIRCGKRWSSIIRARPGWDLQAEPGEMPWLVHLIVNRDKSYSYTCSAAIISEKWLVTAANCIDELKDNNLTIESLQGVAGIQHLRLSVPKDEIIFFDKIIVHENYTQGVHHEPINDIALLRMNSSLVFDKISKLNRICLPDNGQQFHKVMEIAYWDKERSSKEVTDVLRIGYIFKLNNTECRSFYEQGVNQKVMFGYSVHKKPRCKGDSGGPLMKNEGEKYYLAGIVSFCSRGCGRKRFVGVYTRVSVFTNWITDHTNLWGEMKISTN